MAGAILGLGFPVTHGTIPVSTRNKHQSEIRPSREAAVANGNGKKKKKRWLIISIVSAAV